ncbi:MAG: hypothetical protein Q7S95_02115 [bacterium]|nr:hypothetical protein [bacterium]
MAKAIVAGTIVHGDEMERRAVDLYARGFNPAVTKEWKSEGMIDFHCHDRVYTDEDSCFEGDGGIAQYHDAPLWMKQDAVGAIHRGIACTWAGLRGRLEYLVKQKIQAKEKELWLICDCSPDIGDRSFRVALELKKKYMDQIGIKIGIYPIFGFKSHTSKEGKARIELVRDLARLPAAGFLVGLPERDARPDHAEMGFDGHNAIMLDLAINLELPYVVHLGQSGRPGENEAARTIEAVRWARETAKLRGKRPPRVIFVHDLSVASEPEPVYVSHVRALRENNVELCVCPYATISSRSLRQYSAPLHNLIARVLEARLAGVPVWIGTDNICDIFVRRPVSASVVRELDVFANSLRFYDENVIYKIARGEPFNNSDYAALKRNLELDFAAWGIPQGLDAYLAMNPAFQG